MSWRFVCRIISQILSSCQNLVLQILTGKTEFERIIVNRSLPYAMRVHQIENSMNFTSSIKLDPYIDEMRVNRSKSIVYDQLYTVVHKLELYQNLIKQIEQIRLIKVVSTDECHLELFNKIWSRLVVQSDDDDEPMSMISKRWTSIGFQGSNPLTDFRGMGLLGLRCIEYLSRDRKTCLTYVNLPSPHDYSFAIGVINVVSWLVHLLEIESPNNNLSHPLLTHFSIYPCNIDEFFRLFLLIFNEWHEFWIDRKANIMQFEELSKIFRAQMFNECKQYQPIKRGFSTKSSKQ